MNSFIILFTLLGMSILRANGVRVWGEGLGLGFGVRVGVWVSVWVSVWSLGFTIICMSIGRANGVRVWGRDSRGWGVRGC